MLSVPRRRKTVPDPVGGDASAQVQRLQDQVSTLKALLEFAHCLAQEPDLDALLVRIISFAVEVVRAQAGALYLYDAETDTLALRAVHGATNQVVLNRPMPADQGLVGAAWAQRKTIRIDDASHSKRLSKSGEDLGLVVGSMIAVPLSGQDTPMGIVQVINKSGAPFDGSDQELLETLATQAAVAIENNRRLHQVISERDQMLHVEGSVRRRLARDLHDGPSQLLSAMIMNVRFIKKILEREPERSAEEVANLENLSTQALNQVRTLLLDIRPILLDSQDLFFALKSYIDRQREIQDIHIELDSEEQSIQCEPRVQAAIFCFVQHALGNIRKHARARNVWISLRRRDNMLGISIKDDGCGFDVAQVEKTCSERGALGLVEMKERAAIARGQLTIESAPGQGTTLRLLVPLRQDLSSK